MSAGIEVGTTEDTSTLHSEAQEHRETCCTRCQNRIAYLLSVVDEMSTKMSEMHGVFMPLMEAIMQNPMLQAMMPVDVEVPDGGIQAILKNA